jgi:DASS family divalent anion:Na+ symporter
MLRLLCFFLLGVGVYTFLKPETLNQDAFGIAVIFTFTIMAIVFNLAPMGELCIYSLIVAVFTQHLTLQESLTGFSSPVIWLIVLAFFIAKGFVKTGLGHRLALFFTGVFGKSTLGLAYGLGLSDFILAPAIPSSTARAGGVLYPILKALAKQFNSNPEDESRKDMGRYLFLTVLHMNTISSATFLTAMAANPLVVSLATNEGVQITWTSWFIAASVPSLLSFVIVPLVLFKLVPPGIKKSQEASHFAKEELKNLGSITQKEWIMILAFVLLLGLWIFGEPFGISATTTALLGLGFLLFTQVLTWEDMICESQAWNTLVWFAALLTLAQAMNTSGFISWFAELAQEPLKGMNPTVSFIAIALIYFYTHYLFASNTAHVGAMFSGFLSLGVALGVQALPLALILGFCSSLFGALTHYGCGPAPILFGSKYVQLDEWWKSGLFVSFIVLVLWMGIGGFIWWPILGIYK